MRRRQLLLVTFALVLVAAACGGDADTAPTTTTTSSTSSTTTTTTPPPPPSLLTGEPVSDEEILDRPVVAVKFDNVVGSSDDQAGILAADVVYEIPVEGGVTRLLALFQSTDAENIGPIRSARGSEIGLLEELHEPLFTWHGANSVLRNAVRSSAILPRSIDDIPELFYRDRSRPSPYNSFAVGTEAIRATAPEDATGPTVAILSFADDLGAPPSPLAVEATSVRIDFSGRSGNLVDYVWDPVAEQWLRSQKGVPHLDASGEQVAVDNVIVRFTSAVDSGTVDKAGSRVPTAVVTGEGEAWVFSRGTVTTGTWVKPDSQTRTHYLDQNGDEILLTPGSTWISLPFGSAGSSFETAQTAGVPQG